MASHLLVDSYQPVRLSRGESDRQLRANPDEAPQERDPLEQALEQLIRVRLDHQSHLFLDELGPWLSSVTNNSALLDILVAKYGGLEQYLRRSTRFAVHLDSANRLVVQQAEPSKILPNRAPGKPKSKSQEAPARNNKNEASQAHLSQVLCQLLKETGPLNVANIGTRLAHLISESAFNIIKERYGGLKRFLIQQKSLFQVVQEHPFDPVIGLSPTGAQQLALGELNNHNMSPSNSNNAKPPPVSRAPSLGSNGFNITVNSQKLDQDHELLRRLKLCSIATLMNGGPLLVADLSAAVAPLVGEPQYTDLVLRRFEDAGVISFYRSHAEFIVRDGSVDIIPSLKPGAGPPPKSAPAGLDVAPGASADRLRNFAQAAPRPVSVPTPASAQVNLTNEPLVFGLWQSDQGSLRQLVDQVQQQMPTSSAAAPSYQPQSPYSPIKSQSSSSRLQLPTFSRSNSLNQKPAVPARPPAPQRSPTSPHLPLSPESAGESEESHFFLPPIDIAAPRSPPAKLARGPSLGKAQFANADWPIESSDGGAGAKFDLDACNPAVLEASNKLRSLLDWCT